MQINTTAYSGKFVRREGVLAIEHGIISGHKDRADVIIARGFDNQWRTVHSR